MLELSQPDREALDKLIIDFMRDEKTPKTPVENLASHILATVRADDDDPLTEEFVERTRLASYFIEQDGMWMLTGQLYEIEFAGVKTRGEFRQLYRLLGGQMKEDGNYAA